VAVSGQSGKLSSRKRAAQVGQARSNRQAKVRPASIGGARQDPESTGRQSLSNVLKHPETGILSIV
jgi:hypothetical protein